MSTFTYFALCCLLLTNYTIATKNLFCYYGSWAHYRNGNGKCPVQRLDPFLCTHLIYAFVGINEDATIRIMDPWLELPDNYGLDNFREFNKLKQRNPNLKTLAGVGGWNEGSAKFSKVANDPSLRSTFAKNAASFAVKYGFDGIDMDWEYPGQRDSLNPSTDKEAFSLLLQEMRIELDKQKLLLGAAVAAAKSSASISYDIPAISKYLDYVNVMAYDYHGSWDSITGHNAPLKTFENDSLTVEAAIDYWISEGAPPEKLILGMPLYGRTFRLGNSEINAVGSPSTGAGLAGQYTMENGLIGFNELCEKRLTETWPEIWDQDAEVPYAHKDLNWISYDNEKSLAMKVDMLLSKNLGGAMVWSVETDDFLNVCGEGSFPLLTKINSVLRNDLASSSPIYSTTISISTTASTTESTPRTSSTSTTPKTEPNDDICKKNGYIRDPDRCGIFYYCSRNADGSFLKYKFSCPAGLMFDEELLLCNYPYLVNCSNTYEQFVSDNKL